MRVRWMNECTIYKSTEWKRRKEIVFVTNFTGCYHFFIANNAIACLRMNENVYLLTGKWVIFIFILCAHRIFHCNFPAIVYSYDILDVCQITTCCIQNLKPTTLKLKISKIFYFSRSVKEVRNGKFLRYEEFISIRKKLQRSSR